ncbi:hypothetical protein LC612_15310 [Nostoc sp. CHAB 5834]|nr:hypothetical protein [Nostoc sp. CHAB 5834]
MATSSSIQQQELEELKDPTATTFDTSEAQIIKPVFSTIENTRLERLEQLETGTFNAPNQIKAAPKPIKLNVTDGDVTTSLRGSGKALINTGGLSKSNATFEGGGVTTSLGGFSELVVSANAENQRTLSFVDSGSSNATFEDEGFTNITNTDVENQRPLTSVISGSDTATRDTDKPSISSAPFEGGGVTTSLDSDENQIIIGTPNADTLYGADGDDIITSLGIDDIVSGRNGDDLISGGSGNDFLLGDAGKDIIFGDYSASGNSDLIASGNDTIFGGNGNDQLYGQGRQDRIYGDFGNDYIEGGADNDQINGDDGNDILYGDDIEGNPDVSGNDTISGNNGNDKIYGGRGNDSLQGNNGKDLLVGGQGYDSLNGGDGSDVLIGTDTGFSGQLQQGFGFGEKDTLIGGKNNDTFVLGLEKANARDVNGNDTVIFGVVLYNDGNINASGTQDYALIQDFGFINDRVIRGVDKIQLAGSASQYLLGASPVKEISGTGIFFTQGQFVAELIGIVEGISLSNLSLSDSQQFIFV